EGFEAARGCADADDGERQGDSIRIFPYVVDDGRRRRLLRRGLQGSRLPRLRLPRAQPLRLLSSAGLPCCHDAPPSPAARLWLTQGGNARHTAPAGDQDGSV